MFTKIRDRPRHLVYKIKLMLKNWQAWCLSSAKLFEHVCCLWRCCIISRRNCGFWWGRVLTPAVYENFVFRVFVTSIQLYNSSVYECYFFAKHSIAIACRLSVRLLCVAQFVCMYVSKMSQKTASIMSSITLKHGPILMISGMQHHEETWHKWL